MKTIITSVITTLMLLMTTIASAESAPTGSFIAGKDYRQVPYPVPTRDEVKIEVVELFWYGCGHCFKFEPLVNRWAKQQADDVDFHHQPGDFGGWGNETQLHYTMEALNVLDKGRALLFNEYHVVRNKLNNDKKRMAFFGMLGVSKEDYTKTWSSFSVQSKVKQAQARTRGYRTTGVPAMVVNGKYLVDTRSAGSFERMLEVVDFLVARERALK